MHIKTANGTSKVVISKSEWLEIGKKAGWGDDEYIGTSMADDEGLFEDGPGNESEQLPEGYEARQALISGRRLDKQLSAAIDRAVENGEPEGDIQKLRTARDALQTVIINAGRYFYARQDRLFGR